MKNLGKEESPLLQMADIETEILQVNEAAKRGILSPAETEAILAELMAQLREIDEKIVIAARFSGRDTAREIYLNQRRRFEQKYGLPEASTQDADFALALPDHLGSKEVH